jgi:hypothetical protein
VDPGSGSRRPRGRPQGTGRARARRPKLEEILKAKGVLEIVQVLREVEAGKGAPAGDPHQLRSDGDVLRSAPKADASTAEKYVWSKYVEAHKFAKASQYQKAFDMASALLALEPKSAYADQIHHLRKYADNMITQTSLVK